VGKEYERLEALTSQRYYGATNDSPRGELTEAALIAMDRRAVGANVLSDR
jgi:hypothetical protein